MLGNVAQLLSKTLDVICRYRQYDDVNEPIKMTVATVTAQIPIGQASVFLLSGNYLNFGFRAINCVAIVICCTCEVLQLRHFLC